MLHGHSTEIPLVAVIWTILESMTSQIPVQEAALARAAGTCYMQVCSVAGVQTTCSTDALQHHDHGKIHAKHIAGTSCAGTGVQGHNVS